MDLTNKTAIVTGGTRGIGRAIAKALVGAGLRVAITARSEDDIANAISELNAAGPGTAMGYVCDVRDYEGFLTDALEQCGFERVMTRMLLVRHTTASIRVKAPRILKAMEPAPETAPTPF